MVTEFLKGAHRLDDWLQRALGRPYHLILGIGLVIEIVRRLHDIKEIFESAGGILKAALTLALFALLLINQLAELHAHAARRASRRAQAKIPHG